MSGTRDGAGTDPARMWTLAASDRNSVGNGPQWRFHRRVKQPETVAATADFTEMLCQIDARMDRTLPACWMRHAYLFAILDARNRELHGSVQSD